MPLNVPVTAFTVSVANPVAVVATPVAGVVTPVAVVTTTGITCEPDSPTVRIWLFRTFTDTLGEIVFLPVLSVSCAVRECVPSATLPVFHWMV